MNRETRDTEREIRTTRAIVFDMDGVIFDSETLVLQSWREVAALHGITGIEDVCRACIGKSVIASREVFLAAYGDDFPYDTYKPEMSAHYRVHMQNGELKTKPGVYELLTALRENGWRVALASSTRTAVVEEELAMFSLRGYFDAVIGGDRCTRSKPAPDIFLAACRSIDAEPTDTIAVEDSYNGIRAAAAAHMLPVMIPDLLMPTEEMKTKAICILPDLNALQKMLFPEKE